MIGIIDYGRGNLRSVEKALAKVGCEAAVLDQPAKLAEMAGAILPGVGAFADAMSALRQQGWLEAINSYVAAGRPFLGICLGMQLLFEIGEEHGRYQGLGFLPGKVVKFTEGLKVPHMGWNNLHILRANPLCQGVPQDAYFYFVHSYYVLPADEEQIAATADYSLTFTALAGRDNVWGAQFHPEKSSPWGLTMLGNFGKWVYGR